MPSNEIGKTDHPVSDDRLGSIPMDAEKGLVEAESKAVEHPPPADRLPPVSSYAIIPIWISLSGGLIIFNKWIVTTKGFSFPVFLAAYHMAVSMIGTKILRHTTNLLADAETPLPKRIWTHAIVPIGLLYSFSLVLSNAAFVHLSVSFVQMIKASTPVLLHLIACASGLARLDSITAVILLTVSTGCIIATTGELRYDPFGLVCQLGAVITEASRLVLVQVLLRDIKMDPLVTVYYYSPVGLAFIAIALPFLEGARPFLALSHLGWHYLLANGLMAFALNVSSMMLIRSFGSLVSTLSGLLKDIILISASVLVFGSAISGQQVFGYGTTLIGLIAFKEKGRLIGWLNTAKSGSGRGSSWSCGFSKYPTNAFQFLAEAGLRIATRVQRVIASLPIPSTNAAPAYVSLPLGSPSNMSDGTVGYRSDDEDATSSRDELASSRVPREQWIYDRGESNLQWRPAGRRNRIHLIRAARLLLAILMVYGLGRYFERRRGASLSIRETLGIQAVGRPAASSGVTIVSGFFPVTEGRKHGLEEYYSWIKNFLDTAEQPVVFFTTPDLVDFVLECRQSKPIHVIADYETAWEMPPVKHLGGAAWGEVMNKIDPEQLIHVPGVYGPWTAKPWMVQYAKDTDPFHSKFFFWMDAGGFRDSEVKHHLRALPERLEELSANIPNDTIVLGDPSPSWPEGTDYVKAATLTGEMDLGDHIQGGWFGGLPDAIDWWAEETIRMTRFQAGLQRFAGKEQNIWTHTARLFWKKVYVQRMWYSNGQCGDLSWFAYEYWSDSKECQIPGWNGPELWKEEQERMRLSARAAASNQSSVDKDHSVA